MKADEKRRTKLFDEIDFYEAYCLAISIEDVRREFYGGLSQKLTDPRVRNEVLFLESEEEQSLDYFKERVDKLEGEKEAWSGCDPEKKLHKWVESEILEPFQTGIEKMTPENPHEALGLGRKLQKKTIEFYEELLDHEDDENQRTGLTEILDREKKYLKKLNIILSY